VSTADPICISATPSALSVGSNYVVRVTTYGDDVHVVKLDGQPAFMLGATCDGPPEGLTTTCYKEVTKTPTTAGTVIHMVTAVHRSGTPWPAESVTVTISAESTPPPPPPTGWEPTQTLTSADSAYFGVAGSLSDTQVIVAQGSGTVYVRQSSSQGAAGSWGAWAAIGSGHIKPDTPVARAGQTILIGALGDLTGTFSDFCCPREGRQMVAFVSRDGGGSFTRYVVDGAARAIRYAVAVDPVTGGLGLVWMDWTGSSWNIDRAYWLPGMTGWSGPQTILAGVNATGEERPAMTLVGNLARYVWMSGADNKAPCAIEGTIAIPQCTEIRGVQSTDGGVTLGPIQRLTNSAAYAGRPSTMRRADGVEVIVYDRREPGQANEIAAITWTSAGMVAGPFLITPAPGESTHAVVAARPDGGVQAIWMDQDDCPANYCLYTASSPDGLTWGGKERLSTVETPAPQITSTFDYVVAATTNGIPGPLVIRRLFVAGTASPPPPSCTAGAFGDVQVSGRTYRVTVDGFCVPAVVGPLE
jgi:hypothetical protein